MHEPLFFVVAVAILVMVSFIGRRRTHDEELLRDLRAAPIVRIADARHGETVRIVGCLRKHEKLLRAPLSDRKCAHYRVVVKERTGSKFGFHELAFRTQSCNFEVEDSSGTAIVETARLDVAIVIDYRSHSSGWNAPTEAQADFLRRVGLKSKGANLGLHRGFHYEEGIVEPGRIVTIIGRARWEDVPEEQGSERRQSGPKRRLVIEAPDHAPVYVSNDSLATV